MGNPTIAKEMEAFFPRRTGKQISDKRKAIIHTIQLVVWVILRKTWTWK
jgi:hypothetical protein